MRFGATLALPPENNIIGVVSMKILGRISTAFLFLLLSFNGFALADNNNETLKNLGFSASDFKASADLQKILEERRYYLRQHQIWGIVAASAIVATVLSGSEKDLPPEHSFLAGIAVAAYGASAYTSWKAPEVPTSERSGGSAWHRRLVYIHLPGMILAPILGYMAAKNYEKGEGLSGPEKYHRDVAGVTAGALVLSAALVSFDF